MNETELKGIWNAYDKKLEQSLQLNLRIFEDLQTTKARSKLNALLSIKVTGVVIGILWALFLGTLVYTVNFKNPWFSGSILLILAFTVTCIVNYVQHIVLINKIDYSGSIADTQTRLAELQVSTINTTRYAWLQLPFYATFFWNTQWITQGDAGFWLIAFPIAALLALLAVWLYKNITPGNLHKPWVKKFMMIGMEYKYALLASGLLQEIEKFKQERA